VAIPSRAEGLFASTNVVVGAIANVTIAMPQARVLTDERAGLEIARAIERPAATPASERVISAATSAGSKAGPQKLGGSAARLSPDERSESHLSPTSRISAPNPKRPASLGATRILEINLQKN
jgi:hypothetical protein